MAPKAASILANGHRVSAGGGQPGVLATNRNECADPSSMRVPAHPPATPGSSLRTGAPNATSMRRLPPVWPKSQRPLRLAW
jgi:hypothetical protein